MNKRLLAGLIPALGLSMGTMCCIMAENASADGATGGGAATPPVQPVITPVVVPAAPAPIAVPAVTPAASGPQPQQPTYITHAEKRKGRAEPAGMIKSTLQELLSKVINPGQTAPPVAAATPPAAPAAPPVPPHPQAPPPAPAPAPQPAQNLMSDPAFLAMQGKQEQALAEQKKLADELAKMRSEKEAAEEKAKIIDTQMAVRKALENNTMYRLTPNAVTTAAEMLMLKGAIGRGGDGQLYINLGNDPATGKPKHELLDKGVNAWLDLPDGVVFRQAVPAGMGFQASAGSGVPLSFPQGTPGRHPQFSQASFATEMAKANGK